MRKIQLVKSSQSYEQDISLTDSARSRTSSTEAEQALAQITGGQFGDMGYGGGLGYGGGGLGYGGLGYGGGGLGYGMPFGYGYGMPFSYGRYYSAVSSGTYVSYMPMYGGYGMGGGY